mmetsp:Transcript_113219/g.320755  ORF Transcript_113219/g.320755 Transcript_113219/m.320755 type:complete len:252 (+) Transcript_113219:161-916(+)
MWNSDVRLMLSRSMAQKAWRKPRHTKSMMTSIPVIGITDFMIGRSLFPVHSKARSSKSSSSQWNRPLSARAMSLVPSGPSFALVLTARSKVRQPMSARCQYRLRKCSSLALPRIWRHLTVVHRKVKHSIRPCDATKHQSAHLRKSCGLSNSPLTIQKLITAIARHSWVMSMRKSILKLDHMNVSSPWMASRENIRMSCDTARQWVNSRFRMPFRSSTLICTSWPPCTQGASSLCQCLAPPSGDQHQAKSSS